MNEAYDIIFGDMGKDMNLNKVNNDISVYSHDLSEKKNNNNSEKTNNMIVDSKVVDVGDGLGDDDGSVKDIISNISPI